MIFACSLKPSVINHFRENKVMIRLVEVLLQSTLTSGWLWWWWFRVYRMELFERSARLDSIVVWVGWCPIPPRYSWCRYPVYRAWITTAVALPWAMGSFDRMLRTKARLEFHQYLNYRCRRELFFSPTWRFLCLRSRGSRVLSSEDVSEELLTTAIRYCLLESFPHKCACSPPIGWGYPDVTQ